MVKKLFFFTVFVCFIVFIAFIFTEAYSLPKLIKNQKNVQTNARITQDKNNDIQIQLNNVIYDTASGQENKRGEYILPLYKAETFKEYIGQDVYIKGSLIRRNNIIYFQIKSIQKL